MRYRTGTVLPVLLLLATCAPAEETAADQTGPERGQVLRTLPDDIRPESRYLLYLHGAIIEEQGVRPVSPRFGVYEYEAILEAVAARGLVVISEPRGPGTDGEEYARKVVSQVNALLTAGVPPRHITVVGFSKGGGIAFLACTLLENEEVAFVFLATCAGWIERYPKLTLKGRILSIYEASDPIAGSCREAFTCATMSREPVELELRVGAEHGTFYRPIPEWLDPVVAWALE